MSEVSIQMSLPLDSTGFLRRECPTCDRQFKWLPSQSDESEDADLLNGAPEVYYCPYCYAPSGVDAWWTSEQLAYARELVAAETVRPMLGDFGADVERLNRPGGLIRFKVEVPEMPRPDPLTEPEDMVRVDFPCHPDEPLKVDESWTEEIACLVCGIRYPVELVRELSDEGPGQ